MLYIIKLLLCLLYIITKRHHFSCFVLFFWQLFLTLGFLDHKQVQRRQVMSINLHSFLKMICNYG